MCNRVSLLEVAGTFAYQLRDISDPVVRVYCPDCHDFAQFGSTGLIERFGAYQAMPLLLRMLRPCSIGNGMSGPQCQLAYFDRLMPERQAAAIARAGLPATWQVDWHARRDRGVTAESGGRRGRACWSQISPGFAQKVVKI